MCMQMSVCKCVDVLRTLMNGKRQQAPHAKPSTFPTVWLPEITAWFNSHSQVNVRVGFLMFALTIDL